MASSERLWEAWLLSKAVRTRPSDLFAIQGDFRRYIFDKAVATFGTALEAALDEVTGKTEKSRESKRARVLDRWLDRELKYRSPVATMTTTTSPEAAPSVPGRKGPDVQQAHTISGDGSWKG